jgi:hypothetical protein
MLHCGRLARGGHVQVRQDERVAVDRVGLGEPGEWQRPLVRVQGAAATRPGIGGDLLGGQTDPADEQRGVRRPPVGPVVGHRDLRAVHVDRLDPVVLDDAGQQPPQRGDPFGADGEPDTVEMRGAGEIAGEYPGIGAHRHPSGPHPRRQRGRRPAQQIRCARARVGVAGEQVRGQGGLGLRHVATCGRPQRWP